MVLQEISVPFFFFCNSKVKHTDLRYRIKVFQANRFTDRQSDSELEDMDGYIRR